MKEVDWEYNSCNFTIVEMQLFLSLNVDIHVFRP